MSDRVLSGRRVVLLHGLGRSARSMSMLARALRARGAETLNPGYRSTKAGTAILAREVAGEIDRWRSARDGVPIDVVTHSLGGVLVRVAVADGQLSPSSLGRVVMLGPPNGGSELADHLPAVPLVGALYAQFTGPTGRELGTGASGVTRRLPAVDFETGIIAGTVSLNPWFSRILGAPSDGKVRVESTRVAGMRDFVTVPQWHPFLMHDPRVIRQTIAFLAEGRFRA